MNFEEYLTEAKLITGKSAKSFLQDMINRLDNKIKSIELNIEQLKHVGMSLSIKEKEEELKHLKNAKKNIEKEIFSM